MRISGANSRQPAVHTNRRSTIMKKSESADSGGDQPSSARLAHDRASRVPGRPLRQRLPRRASRSRAATGRDPRLVDNPQFLATHPGLDEYFKNHPEVRDGAAASSRPLHGARGLLRQPRRWHDGHPLATTDRYMDSHPEVAQQLEKDPALVDNRGYVDSHPGPARVPGESSRSAPRLEVASVPLHGSRAPLRSKALTDRSATERKAPSDHKDRSAPDSIF